MTDCQSSWYVQLPFSCKWLNINSNVVLVSLFYSVALYGQTTLVPDIRITPVAEAEIESTGK
jgi:hypothetical protein